MSVPERTKIQIWEGPENPVPIPQEMELLDKDTSSLPSLFSRAVVEGAKGIDIYQATYDGRSGYTLFGWRDDKGKTKGQLLHDDKDHIIRVVEIFMEKLAERYDHMRAAQG